MTHEQKAQSYFEEWIGADRIYIEKELIAFAAYCLEKREGEPRWKAYPQNKPTEIGMYLIIQDGLDAVLFEWWASDMFVHYTDVIAFMEIPKYKK
jgi:hypothetical protein